MVLYRYYIFSFKCNDVWDENMGMERERERGARKNTKKNVKWTLNLDSCTRDHILYKETRLDRMRIIVECLRIKSGKFRRKSKKRK